MVASDVNILHGVLQKADVKRTNFKGTSINRPDVGKVITELDPESTTGFLFSIRTLSVNLHPFLVFIFKVLIFYFIFKVGLFYCTTPCMYIWILIYSIHRFSLTQWQ